MKILNHITDTTINKRIRRLAYTLICIFISGCVTTNSINPEQLQSEKIFTPTELRKDLTFIDNSIRKIHPEPFARISEKKYKQLFNDLYLDLSWPLKRSEFYTKVAPLVAILSDLHTQLSYSSYEFDKDISEHGQFPLIVLNTTEGFIVISDLQRKPVIPIGSKILSINDVSINTILDKFKSQVPFETETGQQRFIQVEFSRLLWSTFLGRSKNNSKQFLNSYIVKYLWRGEEVTKKVYGVITKTSKTLNNMSYYGAIPIDDKTSVLWFNDFNEQNAQLKLYLDTFFSSLKDKKVDNLILDIRYNKGGYFDNIALLMSYLTSRRIDWKSTAQLKVSEPFRTTNVKLLDNKKTIKYGDYLDWMPIEYLNLWQWEVLFAEDGEYLEFEIEPNLDKSDFVFKGNLYVLSNGSCYSACTTLVEVIQNNQIATIIGESPGSIPEVQYGYPVELKLPNTGLKISIPAMKINTSDGQTIIPDILMQRQRIDVINGTDPVLDTALELINR